MSSYYVLKYRIGQFLREHKTGLELTAFGLVLLAILAAVTIMIVVAKTTPRYLSGYTRPGHTVTGDNIQALGNAHHDAITGGAYYSAYQGLYDAHGVPSPTQVVSHCGALEHALGSDPDPKRLVLVLDTYVMQLHRATSDLVAMVCMSSVPNAVRALTEDSLRVTVSGDISQALAAMLAIGSMYHIQV
ncbi:MAG TPA: hypothetical protein VLF91_03580 [Candidatus Saccharimonadales bacterium]|nr:hypothetical protein [Candidatus Saccharimonadales bacterium]